MKINKIYDDVYEILDFVTEEEQQLILHFASEITEDEWFNQDKEKQYVKYTSDWWKGKLIHFPHNLILQDINKRVEGLFESYDTTSPIAAIGRHKMYQSMNPHRDDFKKQGDWYIRYGIVIYYNDNYNGGEIDYPEINIKIKPKARSLLLHGGKVLHGTTPVLDDRIRYFSTAFIRGSEAKPVILNKEIFGEDNE